MAWVTRKFLVTLGILAGVAVAAAAGFVWSGVYNVGADDHHTRPVHALMQVLRERSIEVRANELTAPELNDAARITQGSGNYNAMCMGCHLAPGMAPTEMSQGLYPAPPDLTKRKVEAAKAFWVIKHGIKASGMPAWGRSMDDTYIWNMVAFLQKLPTLTPAQYDTMVDSSGGHSHGGGETRPHAHGEDAADDHHAPPAATTTPQPAPTMVEHRHADGTVESHPAPQSTRADDGHDHQH